MGSGRSSKLQLAATPPRKSHQVQLAPGPPSGGILTSPPSTAPTKQGWVPTILCCSSSTKPLGERAPSVVGSCRQLPPAQHHAGLPLRQALPARGAQHVALVGLAAVLRHSRATDPITCRPGGEGALQQLQCSDGHVPPTPQCPGGDRARECLEGGQAAD